MTANTASDAPSKRDVAKLYSVWALDPITALGPRLNAIIQSSPARFKQLPLKIVDVVRRLDYLTGSDPNLLTREQRAALVRPILGQSPSDPRDSPQSAFEKAAAGVRNAAVEHTQRTTDTGERQLLEAFRDAATTWSQQATTLLTTGTKDAANRLAANLKAVVTVLSTDRFASGLGLPPAPASDWPFGETFDGNGSMLVHAVASWSSDDKPLPSLGEQWVLHMQRVSVYGATAIEKVAFEAAWTKDDDEAVAAIGVVYRWESALRELGVSQRPG